MTKLYDNVRKVEARARRLHSDLTKQMSGMQCFTEHGSMLNYSLSAPPFEVLLRVIPRFGPILRIGWKRTHPPEMREALAILDEKGTITLVRKAAQARYFAHNVRISTAINLFRLNDLLLTTALDQTQL